MKDFYAILQVPRNAQLKDIRAAYLRLAKELHPDRNAHPGATKALQDVSEAYAVLKDPAKRRVYDLRGAGVPSNVAASGAVDVMELFIVSVRGRIPPNLLDAIAPVLSHALSDRGVNPRAATAEQVFEAMGILKRKQRRRA